MSKKLNLLSPLGVFLIGLSLLPSVAKAQVVNGRTNAYWDVNGTTTGEGGLGSTTSTTWSTSSFYWTTNAVNASAATGGPNGGGLFAVKSGAPDTTTITNSGGYYFNFTGTSGIVALGSDMIVSGLNFTTDGYTLSTANSLGFKITGTNAIVSGVTNQANISLANNVNLNLASQDTFALTLSTINIAGGTGSSLTLGTGATGVTQAVLGGTVTFDATPIRVNIGAGSKFLFGSQSSGGITVNGNITNSSASLVALNITNSASGITALNGVISGNNGLVLDNTGSGKIVLAGANTYAGGTTVNGTGTGYINLVTSNALGTGTVTISAGSTAYLRAGANSLDFTNAVNIGNGATLQLSTSNSSHKTTWSGVISGAGGGINYNYSDAGLYLTGTNSSFGGGVNVSSSGTLFVNKLGMAGANSSIGTNGTITISPSSATKAGNIRWTGSADETSDKIFALTTTANNALSGVSIFADGAAGATLTLNGNINSTGINNKLITLGASNNNTLVLNGTINQTSGYTNSLVVGNSGFGTVVLSNANSTFGGGLTINAGSSSTNIVQIARIGNAGANSSLGTNGTINIGGGSLSGVNILKYVGTGETNDKVINLSGTDGGATLDQSGTGNLKFTSAMTATGAGAKAITLQGSTAGTGELGGAISDLGGNVISLNKNGSGTWTLSGVNTYTGLTTIGAGGTGTSGILKIGLTNGLATGVLVGASGAAQMGILDLAAGGNYVMNSFGNSGNAGGNIGFTSSSGTATTLTFTNANNYITMTNNGSKTLTNATANLTVAFTGAVDIGSSAANEVTFTGPGSFTLNGALNSTGLGLRGLTKSGDGTLTLNAASGYSGVTTLSLGTIALGANGTLGTNSVIMSAGTLAVGTSSSTIKDLTVNNGVITGSGTLNSANNFTFANTATSTVSANLAGAAAVTQTGSSRVVLSGSNSFSGGLNLNSAGSGVDVTRAAALGTGTITAGSTNSKLGLNTATSLTITNAVNTGSSNTATMAFIPGAVGNSMTVTGLISGSGLSKVSGGGDLYLNNSGNTYSGGTEVGTGRIYVGSDGALGATTGAVNFGTTTNSVLAITSNVSFNANRNFTMSAAGYTANIDTGANDVTINGVISPISGVTGGLLAKLGTGSLTLAGANTYSGATTISSGVLNIRNSAGLGATNAGTTVADLAALELQSGISVGAEALTLNGTGVSSGGALRNISGNNTYGGLLALGSASRINSDSGTLSLTNAGTVAGAFALTVGGAGDIVFNSILGTSTGTLTKDGAGKFTIGGANTFTGLTTVSNGTLAYGVGNALSSGAVTVNGASAVLDIATFSDTVGAVTLTTGSITGTTGVLTGTSFAMDGTGSASAILGGTGATLTKTGAGTTTTLSGANTYSGATTVTSGTLAVNGSLLNSGSVVVNAGGLLGGSGSVGAITGAGTVGPGNSTGILTATSVDPTAGTDFNFEFTALSPTYTSATASGNDLLHLTAPSPFAGGTFASGNIVSIYLNSAAINSSLLAGTSTTFSGGFFVDGTYALASALTSAIFAYYTTSADLGTGSVVDYNGTSYYALANTAAQITLSNTAVESAGFTTGTVAGTLLTFNAVPEPSTGSLLAFGLGGLVLTRLLRRKQI